MSSILNVPLSQGYVSTGDNAKSAYSLEPGELVTMKGAYYRKNDASQPFKMPGRTLFGSTGGTEVIGLAICQFDEGGTDKLLASISTKIRAATPGASGTFTDLITGLNASADVFTACHQDDRWYLGNGYDKNKVLMPNGTTRDMGVPTPQLKLTAATATTSGVVARPTANAGGFTNPTLAYDVSTVDTYASGTLSAPGTITHTWSGFASDTTAGRTLQLRWSLAGIQLDGDGSRYSGTVGTGGTLDAGFNVTYKLEKSDNSGTSWTTVFTETRSNASPGYSFGPAISDAVNSNLVQFRATLTYNRGTSPATLRIWDVKTQYGSTATPFNTTGSMYYAYVWVNANDANSTGALQGAPSDTVEVPAFSAQRLVTITRSESAPTDATHWAVYRTVPGAVDTIDNLGFLALVSVTQTTYQDTFVDGNGLFLDPAIQLTQVLPALTVGDLSIPRDTQPPAFMNMTSWNGSICGFSRTNRRAWRYSAPGLPESFPEFYVVSSFPLPEHDGLVGQMPVGQSMVLLCEGACLVLDDTPVVVDGQFNGATAKPLSGHPGCVGEYAYTSFSVAGEPRGAWVSPFGVYVTNGSVCACISTDLSWEDEVNVPYLASSVLRWDQKNLILWFEFDLDGDGKNDREMPFHMAQIHSKGEYNPKLGQPTPKATSCMASALIGAAHYRFSGHPSNGAVYVEESGAADAATGANVAAVICTGKLGRDKINIGLIKGTLIHGDFGTGAVCTVTTTTYRDSAAFTSQRTNEVSLSGHRGSTYLIGRSGEAFQVQIEYSGSGQGGWSGWQIEVDGQGRAGSAPRWVSTSATP
jgi:hypothetical protein